MIEKGYQHRDISVGNILWHRSGQRKNSVLEMLWEDSSASQYRKDLARLVERCGVTELCNGIVIDGDMAIEFKSYFDGTERRGSRLVCTLFFLSTMLEMLTNTVGNVSIHVCPTAQSILWWSKAAITG